LRLAALHHSINHCCFSDQGDVKILLIDHHELFRDGLRHVLQKLPGGMGELLEAGDLMAGLKCIEQRSDLDLILLELKTPGCSGAESIIFFRKRYPHIPLVVVSEDEDLQVIGKALHYGASGFVGKSSPEPMLLDALSSVFAGDIHVPPQLFRHYTSATEYRLTRRQKETLGCLAEGLTNKEISERLGLAEGTIKVHLTAVYQSLKVRTRGEAVGVAVQIGYGARCYGHAALAGKLGGSVAIDF
jgi:DNA-binding NarL/FixJ family response regulator